MSKLSQETIAVVSVGATLAAIIVAAVAILFTQNSNTRTEIRTDIQAIRAEGRAEREAIRAEDRADREAFEQHIARLRDEGRADREAWQAEMRALREDAGADREAVSRLSGIVEQMRTASR